MLAGKPIELIGNALPAPASQAIATATTAALEVALQVALRTMRRQSSRAASRILHKTLATASGAPLPLDVIEACTDWGVHERPPQPGFHYFAYTDSAGGTGKDSFALAIAHVENDAARTVRTDLIRERKPRFVAADVVAQYAMILRTYGISTVMGDAFAGGFHSDEWARNGITFVPCGNNTSGNYLRALPMLTSGRGRLSDHATLRTQLAGLERCVTGGHETVSHARAASAHDDIACAVCGALVYAASAVRQEVPFVVAFFVGTPRNVPGGMVPSGEVFVPPSLAAVPAAPAPRTGPPALDQWLGRRA